MSQPWFHCWGLSVKVLRLPGKPSQASRHPHDAIIGSKLTPVCDLLVFNQQEAYLISVTKSITVAKQIRLYLLPKQNFSIG